MEKREERERRPTPEELLIKVMHAERQEKRGRLKIFLGFAAGVGKTFEMLCEANRRKQRGGDIVIGYIETHKRQGTEEQLGDLEIVPRKQITYRGAVLEEEHQVGGPRGGRLDRIRSWSMSSRTPMRRAPNVKNAGRMWRCCWTPVSMS